ncbi:MAG: DUF4301 family protein [Bacteroidales bacterium]
MFTQNDLEQMEERGSSVRQVEGQLDHFRKGFPWMKIVGPATPQRGISVLSESDLNVAVAYYESASVDGKCKFVPASGAASRMFKTMFAALSVLNEGKDVPEDSPSRKLVDNIEKFAFYSKDMFGEPSDTMAYRKDVLSKLLTPTGLNYGAKPKGVIKFHRYADGECRTAFAEHLVEAQAYMRNSDGSSNLVVTISPEHLDLFKAALEEVKDVYEKKYGVRYNVTFTYQNPATDTIAVDLKNRPFRTEKDELLFRPGGHGALIYNLNKVSEELVSIKNIDNVANERLLPVTATYKKALMGKCLQLRDRIFGYLREFDGVTDASSAECRNLCDTVESFLDRELCIQLPLARDCEERMRVLRAKLDRPVRVCGMVRNEGEPGGGPYVVSKEGATSLQILESVQINRESEGAMEAMSRATHFNPVDLVCCLRNYKGEKFDLLNYVDLEAGFISSKSYQGRELKALELPGLWNGAMSDWNTAFVEVPLETFNPVKEVVDLLKSAHQL